MDPKDAVDAASGMRKQITDHLTALKSCKDDDIGDMIRESQTTLSQFAAQVDGCQDTQDRLTTQLEEIRIESKKRRRTTRERVVMHKELAWENAWRRLAFYLFVAHVLCEEPNPGAGQSLPRVEKRDKHQVCPQE